MVDFWGGGVGRCPMKRDELTFTIVGGIRDHLIVIYDLKVSTDYILRYITSLPRD